MHDSVRSERSYFPEPRRLDQIYFFNVCIKLVVCCIRDPVGTKKLSREFCFYDGQKAKKNSKIIYYAVECELAPTLHVRVGRLKKEENSIKKHQHQVFVSLDRARNYALKVANSQQHRLVYCRYFMLLLSSGKNE